MFSEVLKAMDGSIKRISESEKNPIFSAVAFYFGL